MIFLGALWLLVLHPPTASLLHDSYVVWVGFTPVQVQRWAMMDFNHQGHSTPPVIMVGSLRDTNQGLNESIHCNYLRDFFKEGSVSTKLKAVFFLKVHENWLELPFLWRRKLLVSFAAKQSQPKNETNGVEERIKRKAVKKCMRHSLNFNDMIQSIYFPLRQSWC